MIAKFSILVISIPLLFTNLAFASQKENEKSKVFGDYVVHYNTLPSSFLDANIAKQHNFVRSKNRILLNIAVKNKNSSPSAPPIPAEVTAIATNLTGQLKHTKMRKIHSAKGVYYIGEFNVSNREYLNFKVTVKPDKQQDVYTLNFKKQFFVK